MRKVIDDDFDLDDDNIVKSDINKFKSNKIAENELLLPSGKVITFNSQQIEALDKIRVWLKSDKQFFTLAGFAGSGKSCCIKKILDSYHRGIVVSATTHKAKKIISNFTGRQAKTLHSLLGLRVDVSVEEFDPNNPKFNPIAVATIGDYGLCVVDEASMINKSLFELIKEKVSKTKTKVIFLGDSAQLPPVGEKMSHVFNDDDIEIFWLTKVERQSDDNPLMIVYDKIRNNLNSMNCVYERITSLNKENEGIIFTISKQEFRDLIFEKFKSSEYKKDSDFCKGLAWKNETVRLSNKTVRNELFGKNADIVEVGDMLMGYRTITNTKNNYIIIENSADYHVIKKSKLEENDYGITGYKIKLREDLARGEFKYDDVFIVNTEDRNNLHLYGEMHDFLKDRAKENKKLWSKYYDFRRNNLIMVNIDKYRNGTYRNTGDNISKDIDYSFFITIHKSQGSTYQHVALIESDVNENWVVKEKNQLLYVGLSRPEISAIVLTTRID